MLVIPRFLFAGILLFAASWSSTFCESGLGQDWPTYNHDLLGTRHNPAETAINAQNAGQLEEKWRFPAEGSDLEIGVIHATPIVVNGYAYFGTASDPSFYKVGPDGGLRWSYTPPRLRKKEGSAPLPRGARFASSADGVLGSALVTDDSVYFADIGGWVYALDRASGQERWTLNTRAQEFPGTHPLNAFFASPILADGKLIMAGGTLEQVVSAFPGYRGGTGRGFVMALEPATGKLLWKYNVGAEPQALDPPIKIADSWGEHVFHFGPGTSTVWSTPSFDEQSGTLFFGTDVNVSPKRPTDDDPNLHTHESCAVIAIDIADGREKWVTQINPGDIWTNAMRAYDPATGRYKDCSVGDTPKIYSIPVDGEATLVVGAGCKNGGFYVFRAVDGQLLAHTPIYGGPPTYPLSPILDPRVLALPSPIGGLQTGCATDGYAIFTNGIDAVMLGTQEQAEKSGVPPTGGRVTSISLDTRHENWRHNRPKVDSVGGPAPIPVYHDVGDPVASGVALAGGVAFFTTVASGKLVAIDMRNGKLLKELPLGPVWSGPSVSRGRVYAGTGNTLFVPYDYESFFPKKGTGELHSFGLPGDDEVSRLGAGSE